MMANNGHIFSFGGFEKHVLSMLDESFIFSNFTDVTLVSDDNKHFLAHKSVLSTSSPVLSEILKNNPDQETFIIFKNVCQKVLRSLLDYIYLGTANISQDIYQEFISIGKELQILGLGEDKVFNGELEYGIEDIDIISTISFSGMQLDQKEKDILQDYCEKEYNENSLKKENSSDSIELTDLTQTNLQQINDMKMQECVYKSNSKQRKFKCDVCEYKAGRSKLKEHKRTKHLGITYPCDKCDFKASSRSSFHQHIKVKHEGIRYKCKHCRTDFTARSYLNIHIRTVHEGTRYSCNECSHISKTPAYLNFHKRKIHEGIRFYCEQCGYAGVNKRSLKKHKESKHDNSKYSCDNCDILFASQEGLKAHTKSKHLGIKYDCEICGQAFVSKAYCSKHMASQHGGNEYACEQCEFKTKNEDSLKYHTSTKHEDFQHSCNQCEYKTGRSDNLKTHKFQECMFHFIFF